MTALCAALAAAPDLDLVYPPIHRTVTHSVGAILFVFIVAIAVTGWVTRPDRDSSNGGDGVSSSFDGGPRRHARIRWGVVWLCTAAYASHLLLDWLGSDPSWPAGIQALWPFSRRWFISGLNVFPYLERREMLSITSILINIKAIAGEILIMGPIVLAIGWLRSRRSPHRPQRSL